MSPRRPLTPGEEILALEILAQETIYGSGTGKPRGILAALEHDAIAPKSSQSPAQPSPRVSTRTGSGERGAGSEGEWRERLAAALPHEPWCNREATTLDDDDIACADSRPRAAATILPTVRRIVAGELRAMGDVFDADARNLVGGEAYAQAAEDCRARADVLDSTDHGKA